MENAVHPGHYNGATVLRFGYHSRVLETASIDDETGRFATGFGQRSSRVPASAGAMRGESDRLTVRGDVFSLRDSIASWTEFDPAGVDSQG